MSIEPASVSNPVMRDNENGSLLSAGGGTQGSATGRKEGQFGSFWDKAVFGAQKLFGMDRASREPAEEFMKNEKIPDSDGRELAEEDEDERKVNRNAANNAELLNRPLVFTSTKPMASSSVKSLNADNQVDKKVSVGVGMNSAIQSPKDSMMPSLPNAQIPETTAPSALTPVAVVQEVSAGGPRVDGQTGSDSTGRASFQSNTVGKEVSALAKQSQGAGAAISELAKSVNGKTAEESVKKEESIPLDSKALSGKFSDGLGFDPEKAKAELSKAMERSRSLEWSRSGRVSDPNSSLRPSSAELVDVPVQSKVATDTLESGKQSIDTKLFEQPLPKSVIAKHQGAQQRSITPVSQHQAASANTEIAGPESSITKKTETSGFGEGIREMRSIDPRPLVNRARPLNANSVGGAATQLSSVPGGKTGLGADAQSQGNSSGNSAKPEFDVNALRENGSKPSVSAPKGDASQGFQLNGSGEGSSSKAAFAAKAQVTNYSSKSVEEVKEVYAALTKSVDRLVNTKGETINLRINFDQGGSMALRVSMEGGKVNTTMQTDLPGLEGLIKSNWSELASDWNAKGVKLNAPQFTHSNGESSREQGAGSFEQRESQSQNGPFANSRARGGRLSPSRPNQVTGVSSTIEEAASQAASEAVGEQELKTYA